MIITYRIAAAVTSRLLRSRFLLVTLLIAVAVMAMMDAPLLTMKEMKDSGELMDFRDMKGQYLALSIMIMGWMANLIAMILGSTVIRQDIKDATIFSVLSKPVSRLQYFVGSTLAAFFCQVIVWCVFGCLWLSFVYMLDKAVEPLYIKVCLCEVLKSLLMLSLALFWSQRFSPWVAGTLALLTFDGQSLIGHAVSALDRLHLFSVDELAKISTFPFPDFSGLDMLKNQLGASSLKPVSLTIPILHLADYALVALLFAWLYFKKQDLTANG